MTTAVAEGAARGEAERSAGGAAAGAAATEAVGAAGVAAGGIVQRAAGGAAVDKAKLAAGVAAGCVVVGAAGDRAGVGASSHLMLLLLHLDFANIETSAVQVMESCLFEMFSRCWAWPAVDLLLLLPGRLRHAASAVGCALAEAACTSAFS